MHLQRPHPSPCLALAGVTGAGLEPAAWLVRSPVHRFAATEFGLPGRRIAD